MIAADLPTRDQFAVWLAELVASGDRTLRDMNVSADCYLTRWLRATWDEDALLQIDYVAFNGQHIDTPAWMFNFQCNALLLDWSVECTSSGFRVLNFDRVHIMQTKYSPFQALEILGRTSDVTNARKTARPQPQHRYRKRRRG